jgi:hypothetical protein
VRAHEAVCYETAEPFSSYINSLYEIKKTASDGALRLFVKLLLNGSYGKFAEKPERESLLFVPDSDLAQHMLANDDDIRAADPEIDPRILLKESIKYAKHAHYAVGSYITAYSRILLHKRMLECDGLAYSDTDSLHCKHWHGIPGNDLGQLKLELRDYYGKFYCAKVYSLHDSLGNYLKDDNGKIRVACKGFPKGSVKDFESIIASAKNFHEMIFSGATKKKAKESSKQFGLESTRTRLLRSQLSVGASMEKVIRLKQFKTWSGLSKKRYPLDDGSTRPWSVAELDEGKHLTAVCPLLGV